MTPVYPIYISEDLTSVLGAELLSILERLLPVRFIFSETDRVEAAGKIIVSNMTDQSLSVQERAEPWRATMYVSNK